MCEMGRRARWCLDYSFSVKSSGRFSSIFKLMCGEIQEYCSDASDSDCSDDWEHNIWNPLIDVVAEYRMGPVIVEFTCHFALDVVTQATVVPLMMAELQKQRTENLESLAKQHFDVAQSLDLGTKVTTAPAARGSQDAPHTL